MLSRLKIPLHCRPRVNWLPAATALLCAASLIASVVAYASAQPLSTAALILQLIALLAVAWQLCRCRGAIHLQPEELAERMLEVQEGERQRLSRELHDDIGQSLTAAKLQLDWLRRRMPTTLHPHCDILRDTLDTTLDSVRDVSALLNPRQLNSQGLEASLRAHLLRALENSDVHWSLECQQRLGGIGEAVTMAAFRITQEAVTNVLRHARAHNLLIRLKRTPEGLRLSIKDDGIGFEPTHVTGLRGHGGMAGMQERIAALQGRLEVISQPGQGTRIEVLFPWPARREERASTAHCDD